MSGPYRLMTIGASHFCEKARWALDFHGIEFREEPHPPVLHMRWSLPSGGGRSLPILIAGDRVIGDSTNIIRFLDAERGNGRRLLPADDELRAEVDELEEYVDIELGPHTRRIAYFHLLEHRKLMLAANRQGVGSGERWLFGIGFPLCRWLMRRSMNIDHEATQRSMERVRRVFDTVTTRLVDGRTFLVGGVFSAADLSFAALAAPVLLPENYGAPLPALEELPESYFELVKELRSTAAGAFAMRIYREWR